MSVTHRQQSTDLAERRLARTVRRACGGDAKAFGRLYDEYADRVYAFIRSRVDSTHDAEDVTATVFLKAWEAIGGYDDRGLPFSAWLFRIARNAVVDEYRRKAHRPVPTEESPDTGETAEPADIAAIAAVDSVRVRAAVSMLTDEQAAVIAMRFWWDMSIKDTADALGKNENAIKALQHRAIRTLARLLQEGEHDGA
ncbi:MAG: sigma-70 family RNA polymerase sigma factor [Coriobacteriia bacterium]|nr:sigma-70 family RNA polymerase sigma factor [Coriobacteriia bacterium]MBN2839375.1 sigma-70 family RNA polymerase sigma factor [Coriobacteriia bacterium]